MTGGMGYMVSAQKKAMGMNNDEFEMKGIYEVQNFSRIEKDFSIINDDPFRWKYMTIDFPGKLTIRTVSGQKRYFQYKTDSTLRYLALGLRNDSSHFDTLNVVRNQGEDFFVEGILQGDSINVAMKKKTFDDFLLTNRGFHWISEQPFNR